MSHTASEISITSVSIDDIRAVLGVTSTDVGTLCTSSHINPWSMAKPVRLGRPFPTSGTIPGTPWWTADGSCGFDIPFANSYPQNGSEPADLIAAITQGWTYKQPTGAASSPYRYGDFRGYKHNASAPFHSLYVSEKVAKGQTLQVALSLGISDDADTPPASLSLAHIRHPQIPTATLDTFHLGALITDQSKQRRFIGTAAPGESILQIAVPDNWTNGAYNLYPFLSSVAINPETGPPLPAPS